MNLKNFMSWRSHCFFCVEELMMFPQISGVKAEFSIQDGYFGTVSRYISFKFHTETGFIIKDAGDPDLDAYLARREVEVQMKCPSCETDGKYYSYWGQYKANVEKTHMELFGLVEKLAFEGIILNQFPLKQTGTVEAYRLFNVDGADSDTSLIKKAKIDIQYIDLFRTSPDKLKNKIKTYITFS